MTTFDGRNSHSLTLLLLGVKAREIRWKKYKWKINNNWQCLMEEIHTTYFFPLLLSFQMNVLGILVCLVEDVLMEIVPIVVIVKMTTQEVIVKYYQTIVKMNHVPIRHPISATMTMINPITPVTVIHLINWVSWTIHNFILTSTGLLSSADWGCRICRLHPCRKVRPSPTRVLDMTLNHPMVRFQLWSFRECGVLLHCHYFQVHSYPGW